jgi:hypothetical protein
MKYIRHRKLGFVIFEGSVRHDDVARQLGGPSQVISAGFIFTPEIELKCLGHSGSLNVGTAPYDSTDLKKLMGAV